MGVARQRAEVLWEATAGNVKLSKKAFVSERLQLTVHKMGQYVRVLFGISDFPFAMLGESLSRCPRPPGPGLLAGLPHTVFVSPRPITVNYSQMLCSCRVAGVPAGSLCAHNRHGHLKGCGCPATSSRVFVLILLLPPFDFFFVHLAHVFIVCALVPQTRNSTATTMAAPTHGSAGS